MTPNQLSHTGQGVIINSSAQTASNGPVHDQGTEPRAYADPAGWSLATGLQRHRTEELQVNPELPFFQNTLGEIHFTIPRLGEKPQVQRIVLICGQQLVSCVLASRHNTGSSTNSAPVSL